MQDKKKKKRDPSEGWAAGSSQGPVILLFPFNKLPFLCPALALFLRTHPTATYTYFHNFSVSIANY